MGRPTTNVQGAKRMSEKKAILDIGRRSPSHGSVVFATLKGAVDAGIEIKHDVSNGSQRI